MLERDMFQDRLTEEKPIGLHEFLYPLMQGYDTVALEADIEIGGTDQTFNMLTGRTLRQKLEGKDKHVLTTPLLEGTDGRKMSKSYHNDIGISDSPQDQFGKIMSMKDNLIIDYFTLCTNKTDKEISKIKERLNNGENPKNIKTELAKEIVQMYHSKKEAEEAAIEFDRIFTQKDLPSEIPKISIPENNILGLHLLNKLLPKESNSQIKRLFKEGAIKHNQEKITSFNEDLTLKEGDVIQIGKRKFFQIKK
jgi:tyrosyl-tRNA synthetase